MTAPTLAPTTLTTPDGRRLDLYVAGPPDGDVGRPVHVWQGRHDRMVPFGHGEWLASHVSTAVPHLFAEHGHLSLAVDSLGLILDELTGPSG